MSDYEIVCPKCGAQKCGQSGYNCGSAYTTGGFHQSDDCESSEHFIQADKWTEIVTTLKARMAELEAEMPKYKPGRVVWVLQVSLITTKLIVIKTKVDSVKIMVTGTWTYDTLYGEYKEQDLHPTPEAAQAAIDKRNGGG